MFTPLVGDILLFRLSPEIQRPLLVTLADGQQVSGELFFDWEVDRITPWCTNHCFHAPHAGLRQIAVHAILPGPEIGQWEPKARRLK